MALAWDLPTSRVQCTLTKYFFFPSCPAGHYCPGANDAPIRCDNGYYQTLQTQTTCDICDAGYYCDNTVNIAFVNATSICPEGYYCPTGTRFSNEFPCPIGTFNNITGTSLKSYSSFFLLCTSMQYMFCSCPYSSNRILLIIVWKSLRGLVFQSTEKEILKIFKEVNLKSK